MSTKNLIDNLSKNLAPSKPLPGKLQRWLRILLISSIGVGTTFLMFSIRHDLADVLRTRQFLFGAIMLIVSWLISAYSIATLEVPSSSEKKYWRFALVLILTLGIAYLSSGLLSGIKFIEGISPSGLPCSLDIIFMSLLPGVAAFYFLRRSASSFPELLGANLGLTCGVLASFALQFSCPHEEPSHLLVWHTLLPISVLVGIGILAGRKALKW
jgi:hypothetical protein